MDRLLLLDASSYFYRAYYAMPALVNAQGELTGAIYGTVNMLRSLLNQYPSRYVAVVFDSAGPSMRKELYPAYKANRPHMPDEMFRQLAPTKEIMQAMGFYLLERAGVEADDLLGSLASYGKRLGLEVIISTGDKDLAQLVDERVILVDTMSHSVYDPDGVEHKFGVKPNQIVDYLMLLGDSSDNIPGVSGIGKVTAAKLLQEYGNIENMLTHSDQLSPRIAEKLQQAKSQFAWTRQLITLQSQMDLSIELLSLQPLAPDWQKLVELYQYYDFRKWLKEAREHFEIGNDVVKSNVRRPSYAAEGDDAEGFQQLDLFDSVSSTVSDEKLDELFVREVTYDSRELQQLLEDLQTTRECELLLLGEQYEQYERLEVVCYSNGSVYHFSLADANSLTILRTIWQIPAVQYFSYDVKFWWKLILKNHWQFGGIWHDVKLAAYLQDNAHANYNLDEIMELYLNLDVAGRAGQDNLMVTGQLVRRLKDLYQGLEQQLADWSTSKYLLEQIDMPLAKVLAAMELHGVQLDAQELIRYSGELAEQLTELEEQIYQSTGMCFNLNSPKQLADVLYKHLQLPALKRTGTGQHSTSEQVLQKLIDHHPVVAMLLKYRGLMKMKSTYLDPLPQLISPTTGRVRTHYHQTSVLTGRLSSSAPNLQNIPMWSEAGQRIRRAFLAPTGKVLLAIDYSQIELRVMAHLAGDQTLINAFCAGEDVHRHTAAEVLGVAPEEVTEEDRRLAKTINFGLIYGMSSFGLAERLGMSRPAAASYVKRYFAGFPGVEKYIARVHEQVKQQGYVTTILGRKLFIPNLGAAQSRLRQAAYRVAVNATVQGSAAELIKLAMLSVQRWIESEALDILMLMQVHDELIFELPAERASEYGQHLKVLMENVYELRVPLVASVGCGATWEAAKH